MTVREKLEQDITEMTVLFIAPTSPATCVICGVVQERRYGCCFRCANTTDFDDPRVLHDTRNDPIDATGDPN